jgi:hypothetical protein
MGAFVCCNFCDFFIDGRRYLDLPHLFFQQTPLPSAYSLSDDLYFLLSDQIFIQDQDWLLLTLL